MNVMIFGATGRTGRRLVQRALDAGHDVTGIARTPAKLDIRHECLVVEHGDITEYSSFADALAGQDVVVSAVGGGGRILRRVTLFSDGITNIIRAMNDHEVSRLLVISAPGANPDRDPNLPLFYEIFQKIFSPMYTDLHRMEEIIRDCDLDWTIVRPSALKDEVDLETGTYQSTVGYSHPDSGITTRDHLAEFIIDQIDTDEYVRDGVAVVSV
jgi:putative NADH-flavin reductase